MKIFDVFCLSSAQIFVKMPKITLSWKRREAKNIILNSDANTMVMEQKYAYKQQQQQNWF